MGPSLAPADWFEIAVAASDDVADDLAALLVGELGDASSGVEQRPGEVVFWIRPERCEAALAAARQALGRLADAGLAVDPRAAVSRPAVPESEWRDAWKRYFKVIHLTRQIVVVPSWESYLPTAADRVVHLDPGQAFGTGAHASTRLVLMELQALADEGARPTRVLDVGTGSGILAIAAAKLWPDAEVLATDEDPLAVATARDNLDKNALAHLSASTTALADLPGHFDLIVANIQANVLEALAGDLVARLAPAGRLVLSGLLAEQAPGILDHYVSLGLTGTVVRPAPPTGPGPAVAGPPVSGPAISEPAAIDPAWSAVRLTLPARP